MVDLGCGSGLLAKALCDAGHDAFGIDISKAMVALARTRAPAARFRVASLYTVPLPRCVAVTAIGECFNYLFDPRSARSRLLKLFRRVYSALEPNGVFVFDLAGPGPVPGSGVRRSYVEGRGWAVLVAAAADRRRSHLTRQITSFRKVGELYRRDHEIHRLRLVAASDIAAQLRAIGFRVRVVRRYGPLRLPPGLAGFIARKPQPIRSGAARPRARA